MLNAELIAIGLSQIGIKEIVGKQDNPEVLKYFESCGFPKGKFKDETAWCSAFMNWIAKEAGAEASGALNARSWLKVGEKVENPQMGDVAVFWRGSKDDWRGHVAIYIRETKNWVYVLGGNQGNQVKISAYPKHRLLQYRRLNRK